MTFILVARKKSLFDDRPVEIQELTYIIKGDLNSLNQQIARLQDISKSQRKSTNGKHLLSHSSNMVVALQAKLANMSSDFKQVLEVRTENLKQQKNRRDQVNKMIQVIDLFHYICFLAYLIFSSVKDQFPTVSHHQLCGARITKAVCC